MTNYDILANLYQEDVDLGILNESLANELNDITYDLYTEGKLTNKIIDHQVDKSVKLAKTIDDAFDRATKKYYPDSKEPYKVQIEWSTELWDEWIKKHKKILIATGVVIAALVVLAAREDYKFDKEVKRKVEEIEREHQQHKKEIEEFNKQFKKKREMTEKEMTELQGRMRDFSKSLTSTYKDAKNLEDKYK